MVVRLLHVRKLPATWCLSACMCPSLPVVVSSSLPTAAIVFTMCQSQLPQTIEQLMVAASWCACQWCCRVICQLPRLCSRCVSLNLRRQIFAPSPAAHSAHQHTCCRRVLCLPPNRVLCQPPSSLPWRPSSRLHPRRLRRPWRWRGRPPVPSLFPPGR